MLDGLVVWLSTRTCALGCVLVIVSVTRVPVRFVFVRTRLGSTWWFDVIVVF